MAFDVLRNVLDEDEVDQVSIEYDKDKIKIEEVFLDTKKRFTGKFVTTIFRHS
jgi:hypothetical protein